jgi:glyoxylase I family protein
METRHVSPLTGLSHLQLFVSDVDASVAWYTNALGLEETNRMEGRYVGLRATNGQFRLALSPGGERGNHGALNHIAFSVADLDALTAWVDHLTAIGIAHEGIKLNPLGHSVDMFDPDGNNIELVSETDA